MRQMGVPSSVIEQYRQEHGLNDVEFGVWAENWNAALVFQRSQTQWATDFGVRTGLNLTGVCIVAEILGVEMDEEVLTGIQVMESTTLRELQRRADMARQNSKG